MAVDADETVRSYAALSLGLLGTPQIVPALRAYLATEQSSSVRVELAGAAYRLGAQDELNVLLHMLDIANESLAMRILNCILDLTRRKRPLSLVNDTIAIRQALHAVVNRFPIVSSQVDGILGQLMTI